MSFGENFALFPSLFRVLGFYAILSALNSIYLFIIQQLTCIYSINGKKYSSVKRCVFQPIIKDFRSSKCHFQPILRPSWGYFPLVCKISVPFSLLTPNSARIYRHYPLLPYVKKRRKEAILKQRFKKTRKKSIFHF